VKGAPLAFILSLRRNGPDVTSCPIAVARHLGNRLILKVRVSALREIAIGRQGCWILLGLGHTGCQAEVVNPGLFFAQGAFSCPTEDIDRAVDAIMLGEQSAAPEIAGREKVVVG